MAKKKVKHWNKLDVMNLRIFVARGMSFEEIGKKLGRTPTAVQGRAMLLGIYPGSRRRKTR